MLTYKQKGLVDEMKIIDGGVTMAKGYLAAGVYAGIKKKKKDMALVYSKVPAKQAGTFTTNVVKAAPVKWDIRITHESEYVQAMVFNTGYANACTGIIGDENNKKMADAVATAMNIPLHTVYTASTGVIGPQLPIDVICKGVTLLKEELADTIEAGSNAAEAIMTTDTHSKECAVEIELGGKKVVLGGMSKGSGMIHPNMATMLGIVTTDASISKSLLQEALSECVADSFNMISVDRDTSTNDSFVILANGLAGNEEITTKNTDYEAFKEALLYISKELAKKMAADGEGASKLIEATILNAKTKQDAVILSKSVITSNLVKAAVFGNDANCGRILCALGYSGVDFNPDVIDLYIECENNKLQLVKNGTLTDYSEEVATEILSASKVIVVTDMKQGNATATAWGCDLTYDYVKINADYRS